MINNFFTKNIWLKAASLVLAIAMWFFVMLSGRSEITLDIPVSFTDLPPAFVAVDYPKSVSVSIEGQERIIRNLRQNEIQAVIDISGIKTGKSFFTLSKDNIKLPKTLIVTGIDPETVSLKIEPQLKKTVKVKPAVIGLPEKGFKILEVKVEPAKLELEGPRSMVRKIYTVKTEPIDINGINDDLIYKANLNISDSRIKKSINKVEVSISVKKIDKETK